MSPPRLKSVNRVLFAAIGWWLAWSARADDPGFTPIAALRSLSAGDLAKARAVRVRGVVTWSDGAGQFTLQDESAGIFINAVEAQRRGLWQKPGIVDDRIREGIELIVTGVTDPGGYAPVILPNSIALGLPRVLPVPRPMDTVRFFSGADAAQRVEVWGVPMGFEPISRGWALLVAAGRGQFTVEITSEALLDPASVIDADVRFVGVVGSGFNTRSELTNVRLLIGQAGDLHIEKPAPASPFDAPRSALDRLLPFYPEPAPPHRIVIEGVVTLAVSGQFFYLQEGNSAVRVKSTSAVSVQAGDRVQAAGFVDMSRHIGQLLGAVVRKVGTDPVPEPIRITPEEVIALNAAVMDSGQPAHPHDFDGHLIRFSARLLSVRSSPDRSAASRSLILENHGQILSAILPPGGTETIDALQPDSEVMVTGIVQLEYAWTAQTRPYLRPNRLDLLLRGAGDVAVIHAPSWWTAQRLLGVIAAGALALGSALLWVSQLRRQIRRKTEQLAAEMHARRDAAIEFQAALRERNRLAANLHDTLLQTMGGLGFQIQACEAKMSDSGESGVHLEVARKMLDHAVTELRDSVWALRSLPLHGLALPEALQSLAERAGEGHKVHIELRTAGELSHIPNFVAGNLLLAAQEAVHNALKHGRPSSVIIEARADDKPGWISISVSDDGSGFTVGEQVGAAQGHFGLAGTRERIERLAGSFQIQSAPGKGAVVQIKVPLRSYDEGVAEPATGWPEGQ